jgi:hypothetical protein
MSSRDDVAVAERKFAATMRAMSASRFFVAFAVVVAFLGVAYLWTRPTTRIDQTITSDPSSTPHARRH